MNKYFLCRRYYHTGQNKIEVSKCHVFFSIRELILNDVDIKRNQNINEFDLLIGRYEEPFFYKLDIVNREEWVSIYKRILILK